MVSSSTKAYSLNRRCRGHLLGDPNASLKRNEDSPLIFSGSLDLTLDSYYTQLTRDLNVFFYVYLKTSQNLSFSYSYPTKWGR
jgi:hypothetical protein